MSWRKSFTGDFQEPRLDVCAHWLWALYESGLSSGLLYLIGTAIYVVALPYSNPKTATHADSVKASWLWLAAALVFLVEAVIDVTHALWTRRAKSIEGSLLAQEYAALENQSAQCMPWLNNVDFSLWQSIFFLLPSALYVEECLLDPNVVVLPWLNLLHSRGWTCYDFATLLDNLAASGFLLGSFVSCLGRFVTIRMTARENNLVLFQVWKAEHFFDLNWSAYGDGLFVVGSVFAVICSFKPDRSRNLEIWTDVIWLLDALCYMCGSSPLMCAILRTRQRASAPTTGPWPAIQRYESRQMLRKRWSSYALTGMDFSGE